VDSCSSLAAVLAIMALDKPQAVRYAGALDCPVYCMPHQIYYIQTANGCCVLVVCCMQVLFSELKHGSSMDADYTDRVGACGCDVCGRCVPCGGVNLTGRLRPAGSHFSKLFQCAGRTVRSAGGWLAGTAAEACGTLDQAQVHHDALRGGRMWWQTVYPGP
jgi:hypothetical protein